MPKYLIASVRGNDFHCEGENPVEAFNSITDKLIEDGQLWRTSDGHRNIASVKLEGFTLFDPKNPIAGAWKKI